LRQAGISGSSEAYEEATRDALARVERIMTKRSPILAIVAAAIAMLSFGLPARGQEPKSIKIGYAISLTGPGALGAQFTQLADYRLWVKEVNAGGGIMLSSIGKRVPIEVIEYDDHSNLDDAILEIDRLIRQDQVDFLLPPWGTEFNVAAAPLFSRGGFPDLVVTANTDQASEFAKRWPNSFWFLGTATAPAQEFIDAISSLHREGKLGGRMAMVSVADQFGIGLARAARRVVRKTGFQLVYDRSYPVDLPDAHSMISEVKKLNPDVFAAFSYPPDTMAITEAARAASFNPKVFYTAVGTAFPLYKQRFGADVDGVMGIGGWNPDLPDSKAYFQRHVALTGQEPDRWASPITYASLQMLQQAIERVGKIDRAAVIKELQTGTFDTIVGQIKLQDNIYTGTWYVGQWQNGDYYGIAPATLPGARPILFPKPPWHAQQ
jgi:branched-chain amino acid transport system substrate-binding protein